MNKYKLILSYGGIKREHELIGPTPEVALVEFAKIYPAYTTCNFVSLTKTN